MPLPERYYDYIIAGGGCAGLSLATRMAAEGKLAGKKILLIDREEKSKMIARGAIGEKDHGFFESIVHKSWNSLEFIAPESSRRLDINPYRYKMIRSGDFYERCNSLIASVKNVERVYADIDSFSNKAGGVVVNAKGQEYSGRYLFNSTLHGIHFDQIPNIFLRQHFRGWFIETQQNAFDPNVATLMDFRIPQTHGTGFFYTLPLSQNRALVEYTLFTKEILESEEYRRSLESYISKYITTSYQILEEENGVIPMTNYPFKVRDGNIINIGTAGGQTKGSTGYTFQFIQKGTARIVSALSAKDRLGSKDLLSNGRFARYDSILLRVLESGASRGADLFVDIFRKGPAHAILRFLDNESSFGEELSIMARMPKITFLRAALREFW